MFIIQTREEAKIAGSLKLWLKTIQYVGGRLVENGHCERGVVERSGYKQILE
jgi:hypothetical protein